MSELKSQQILLPKQVYIGDTAELRCTFNSGNEVLKKLTEEGSTSLPLDSFLQTIDFSNFDVKELTLTPAGVDFYQLTVTFVPWKTGSLQLPPVLIDDITVEFLPVKIESLTAEKNLTSLKESAPPLLLPGTTYKIYALVIVIVLLLIALIRLLICRKKISFFFRNLILDIKCKRSKKITQKKLLALNSDENINDKIWAENVEKLLPKYLSVKFQHDYSKITSSEIMPVYLKITGGILESKNECMGRLAEIFVRTDYIRYSSQNSLQSGERNQLTEEIIKLIEKISAGEAK